MLRHICKIPSPKEHKIKHLPWGHLDDKINICEHNICDWSTTPDTHNLWPDASRGCQMMIRDSSELMEHGNTPVAIEVKGRNELECSLKHGTTAKSFESALPLRITYK